MKRSQVSVVISIALVLFMLGTTGLLLLQAGKVSNYVRENIGFTVYLRDDVRDVDIRRLQKSLEASNYVNTYKIYRQGGGRGRTTGRIRRGILSLF